MTAHTVLRPTTLVFFPCGRRGCKRDVENLAFDLICDPLFNTKRSHLKFRLMDSELKWVCPVCVQHYKASTTRPPKVRKGEKFTQPQNPSGGLRLIMTGIWQTQDPQRCVSVDKTIPGTATCADTPENENCATKCTAANTQSLILAKPTRSTRYSSSDRLNGRLPIPSRDKKLKLYCN